MLLALVPATGLWMSISTPPSLRMPPPALSAVLAAT